MALRLALLTLAAFILAAPTAGAAVADRYVPFYDAPDGVTSGFDSHGALFLRFGSKAASIYRRIGGQRGTRVACDGVIARPNGATPISGGYTGIDSKLPRKRSRVYPHTLGSTRPMDVCAVATKRVSPEYPCLPLGGDESARCVRVIVALTDLGRAYVDARSRAIELFQIKSYLGVAQTEDDPIGELRRLVKSDAVVALPTPDAAPPTGNVGVWLNGENYAIGSVLQDGRLLFARYLDGVYSTHIYEFIRDEEPDHTVFSLFS
jgi:hypothetical protein